MQALIDVILPVFLVLGAGYLAAWRQMMSEAAIDGLMKFAQQFAVPALLFSAISTLDLGAHFSPALLFSYYAGVTASFLVGMVGARTIFDRPWEDSVAIGFVCMFANSVLLGLPITERAYGPDALQANFAIIALNAPFCYGVGVTVMEILRNKGSGTVGTARKVFSAMFRNALVIGIALGFVVNLGNLTLPGVVTDALDLIIRAALPAALFGLGGILFRYRPEGDMRTIMFVCAVSLVVHPVITFGLAKTFGISLDALRSATLTAAMAPGINAYLFANIYGVAKRVAASAVLFATAGSILSVWVWLLILG